jgi:CDP-diacylglycerol--glycerol-3-phosphate 3-phosphatidyltransferase
MRVSANQVTVARLLGMPIVGCTLFGSVHLQIVGVIVGTLIGLTDFVDGYLARKHGPTVLGSLLDPVADKIFIVVCYGCFVSRGGIPWWVAAAILSRELLVTVLRSSLELGGHRLPSSGVAKAKTWVQMVAFAFLVLIPIVGQAGLRILFAVPFGFALSIVVAGRVFARTRWRGFEIAAWMSSLFLAMSFAGATAVRTLLVAAVVFITWYSAVDYLAVGLRYLRGPLPQRGLHWLRLAAGGLLPIVASAALGTGRVSTVTIIVLLSSVMARGALDNFAAHRGVADFSWAASLWAEIALIAAALALDTRGNALALVAALIGVTETLRSLARHLRAPAAAPRPSELSAASSAREMR